MCGVASNRIAGMRVGRRRGVAEVASVQVVVEDLQLLDRSAEGGEL
jgi:hypothetical protein